MAICVYVKMVNFLCLWDNRAKDQYYSCVLSRNALLEGEVKVVNEALIDQVKIVLPPFHIELGLMKPFVKVLVLNNCPANSWYLVKKN